MEIGHSCHRAHSSSTFRPRCSRAPHHSNHVTPFEEKKSETKIFHACPLTDATTGATLPIQARTHPANNGLEHVTSQGWCAIAGHSNIPGARRFSCPSQRSSNNP